MKNKLLSCVNLIITLFLIYWNYLSNTGFIEGKTIGDLSVALDQEPFFNWEFLFTAESLQS